MSLIPVGHSKEMKKQMVRPVYTTDLSALLKLGQAMPPQPPGVETEQTDLNAAPGAEDMGDNEDGGMSVPGILGDNDISNDFGAAQGVSAGGDNTGDSQGTPQEQEVKSDEQEEAESHSDILKLRYALGELLDKAGLDYDPDTGTDSLTITVDVSPKIRIKSTGQREPAHLVLRPIIAWAHKHRMKVKEQVRNNQNDDRLIDKNGKTLSFIFSYQTKAQGEENTNLETTIQQPLEQSVGNASKQKVPLQSDKLQQQKQQQPMAKQPLQAKPPKAKNPNVAPQEDENRMKIGPSSSKLGNPGKQRAASSDTLREVLASRKDSLIKTLNKIIGGQAGAN